MAYTETKERNEKRYFYRVVSIRNGKKVSKKRKYLGADLSKKELSLKERDADKELELIKRDRKKEDVEIIKSKIAQILKRNKIKRAGIFGSYSRGEQKKNSDIDILIEPPKGIGFGFVGIILELEKKLGKKVHLVTYKFISPYIKKDILKEEVRII